MTQNWPLVTKKPSFDTKNKHLISISGIFEIVKNA